MTKRKTEPKVSLIVSTYNRPDALNLCLQSIAKQKRLPDEVIIGDDGSKKETVELINAFQKNFPVPIIHVWQEDNGFRLAMCRNKAVAASSFEYIVQIDGDLILHHSFISDHILLARKGHYLKGGRVNLTQKLTDEHTKNRILPPTDFWSNGLTRRSNAIHSTLLAQYLAPRYKKNRASALGCNMSFWKEDYIKINGYDEFFEGWGGEDSDFAARLINSGVNKLYLKFSGIVFHLWHNDLYMQNKDKNFEYFSERLKNKTIRCANGIDKYL